jgi:Fe-S-cluster containining protein
MRLRVLDDSVRFSCRGCTACCDQPSETLIEADKAHALDTHDFTRYPQLAGKTFYRQSKSIPDGFYLLAKGTGTRCVFLDTDGLCIIHKELGPEAKPGSCRRFPYVVAHTSAEDRVSADFGCPTVQDHAGPPLAEQVEEIAAAVALGSEAANPCAPIPLDPACGLTPEEAEALFDRLRQLFTEDKPGDIWTRFGEALALLAATRHFKLTVLGESAGGASQTLIELLRSGVMLPGHPTVPEVTSYGSPSAAPGPARQLFAATLYRDTLPLEAVMNLMALKWVTLLPRLMSLAKLNGVYASRLLGRNVPVRDVMMYPVESEIEPGGTRLLLRYYRSRFWQRYLMGTRLSMVGGLHQHIHDLNAIIFLARADAYHIGASRLTESLIRRGLSRVEFHLANQTRLFDQNLIGWFRAHLENAYVAFQSLRLMSLTRPPAVGRERVESGARPGGNG